MNTVLLTTKRLKIRNLRESDLRAFHQYRSNPEITKYQGFDTFSKEQAKAFIAEQKNKSYAEPGEWVQYGIENILTNKLVGDCAIHLQLPDPEIAEIGITISHLHQGQGYAKETMIGLLNFLFREKRIQRIVETVDAGNIPSIQLFKSLSFRQENHSPENIFFKGKWGSEYRFVMLKTEWMDPVSKP